MIVVIRVTKNTCLRNDALAYHTTIAGGVGGGVNVDGGVNAGGGANGGVNVGGGDSDSGWVVCLIMMKSIVMEAVGSVVGVLYLVYTLWFWQHFWWWLCLWL